MLEDGGGLSRQRVATVSHGDGVRGPPPASAGGPASAVTGTSPRARLSNPTPMKGGRAHEGGSGTGGWGGAAGVALREGRPPGTLSVGSSDRVMDAAPGGAPGTRSREIGAMRRRGGAAGLALRVGRPLPPRLVHPLRALPVISIFILSVSLRFWCSPWGRSERFRCGAPPDGGSARYGARAPVGARGRGSAWSVARGARGTCGWQAGARGARRAAGVTARAPRRSRGARVGFGIGVGCGQQNGGDGSDGAGRAGLGAAAPGGGARAGRREGAPRAAAGAGPVPPEHQLVQQHDEAFQRNHEKHRNGATRTRVRPASASRRRISPRHPITGRAGAEISFRDRPHDAHEDYAHVARTRSTRRLCPTLSTTLPHAMPVSHGTSPAIWAALLRAPAQSARLPLRPKSAR